MLFLERSQWKQGDVNGNCHNRITYVKETRMELKDHRRGCSMLVPLWTFEPTVRPHPGHYLFLTMATSPSVFFILKKATSSLHLHRRPKWRLNSWTSMLAWETHPRACLLQSLINKTWPIPFELVITPH